MKRQPTRPLPLMAAELALCSWEVIARRSLMMAQGQCSPLEYHRMVTEKVIAAQASATAMMAAGGEVSLAAILAPWHRAARANAKRLRGK